MTFDDYKQLYLDCRFNCEKSEQYVNAMLSIANTEKNNVKLGVSYYYQAELYYYKNLLPTSELLCNRALQYFKSEVTISEKISCNNLLGILSDTKGNTILAIDYYLHALSLSELINDKQMLSVIYNNLADMHLRVHNYDEAIELLNQSVLYLDQNKKIDQQRLFYANLNLCYCYNGLNDLDKFEFYLGETERFFCSNISMQREKMHLYILRTIMQCRKQNFNGVKESFKNVFANLTQNLQLENIQHFIMAIPYWLQFDRIQETKQVLDYCDKIIEEHDIMKIRADYYTAKIVLALRLGNVDEAKELALKFVSVSNYVEEEQRRVTAKSIKDRISLYEMQKRYNKAEKQAITDSLTKIYNRHAFKSILIPKFELAKQNNKEVAIVILDIDHFKAFNDRYGHIEGDKCLKQISKKIIQITNNNTVAARYGGDEFVIMFCNNVRAELYDKLNQLQKEIDALQIQNEKSPTGYVTVTFGVHQSVPLADENIYDYILYADRLLYRGKQDRDCISF